MGVALSSTEAMVMVTKSRKYLVIGALALAMLFCGPATSKLLAWDVGPHVSFYGSFPVPYGNIVVSSGYPYYGYPAPAYAPYAYPYYRPYRVVRVFVPVPFPHWVFRRVYYAPHYGYRYGYRPY